jgi:hypothetical protein
MDGASVNEPLGMKRPGHKSIEAYRQYIGDNKNQITAVAHIASVGGYKENHTHTSQRNQENNEPQCPSSA